MKSEWNDSKNTGSQKGKPKKFNPWIAIWSLLILIILSVNATMIYLAMDSNPGLVVEDYYERGQNYEKTILSRQALSQDLSLRIDVPPQIHTGQPATFRFTGVRHKTGEPIHADTVTLYAYRPSDTAVDFSVPMNKIPTTTKDKAQFLYLADVVFPLKGVWDIVIAVRQGEIEHNAPARITVADHQEH
uniref:Nitrogen fixation protein FixH n=1 Tax=Candidatus Kentrum sp. MB TaxID=2138164 RepID=A0A451B791_9GAMM|nr:MAG: Nitrogen fixation protein FixH [Candidatus Kentron sp. MB]VFK28924.1 MAG: Nitrogen fixation protein FixH [Candidatus Kentron sp. MB]VFK74155.1 MAG: Nitrogen fixation protein FixH [Candidatus Kentron sp. MB]